MIFVENKRLGFTIFSKRAKAFANDIFEECRKKGFTCNEISDVGELLLLYVRRDLYKYAETNCPNPNQIAP